MGVQYVSTPPTSRPRDPQPCALVGCRRPEKLFETCSQPSVPETSFASGSSVAEKTDGRDAVRRPAPSGSASARPRQLYVNAGLAIISVCGHEANQRSPMSAIGIRIKFLFDVDLGDRSGELHRATAGTRQTALTRAWNVLGQDTP